MLERMWRNKNTFTLLVEYKLVHGSSVMEDSVAVPQRAIGRNIMTQQSHYLVYTQRTINNSTIRIHACICSLQHSSQ